MSLPLTPETTPLISETTSPHDNVADRQQPSPSIWTRFVALVWQHAEESKDADTNPFNGIL